MFFGLDKCKRAILDAGFAIICEGQLDLIACHSAGICNLVAPQGTAFTPEHARILKRYVEEVVLCFDSDSAGQNAAVRVFDSLLAAGLAIRVATVPAPHDPDSLIKAEGAAAFQKVIDQAEGFFDFLLNRLCLVHNATTDRGRMAVVREMADALRKTGSAVMLDTYAQKTALRLAVSTESVRLEFKKSSRPGSPLSAAAGAATETEGAPEADPLPRPPSEREFWLLRFLLISDDHISWVARHLDLNWVTHPGVRRAVAARLEAEVNEAWQGVPALIDAMDDPVTASLITEAVTAVQARGDLSRNLAGLVQMLRNDFCDQQLSALSLRLGQPGWLEQEAVDILQQQRALRTLKQQPLSGP